MRNPETYEEFREWLADDELAGTREASEWAEANREKYTDLRITALKKLPRDLYRQMEKAEDREGMTDALYSDLWFSDRVDRRGYHGDPESARYWDAYCKHFGITRATLYAARVKVYEARHEEVMENPESTLEDIRKAWSYVKHARKDYHDAKNYKILREKHHNVERAKQLYDEILDGKLAEAPGPNFILKLSDLRPSIITEVMHRMRIENHSKSPSRPTVDSWLKSYREL